MPWGRLVSGVLLLVAGACGDLVGTATLPAGAESPNTYNTPEGALGVYREAKVFVSAALADAIIAGGALTDELAFTQRGTSPASLGALGDPVDERILPENSQQADAGRANTAYIDLHGVREHALQAIGMLRSYAPATSPALRGELYALEGYAELALAELYCSGVPLSTLDFEKDFTYRPSSTTTEVWQHAVALLDTALTLSSDSVRTLNLARVLRGRALLDLGDYAAAAQAVASVPDTFRYAVPVQWGGENSAIAFLNWTVADTEGGTGLPFVSRGDPRAAVTLVGHNTFGLRWYVPVKYPLGVTTPTVLASGVEARLIEAEAALHRGDASWLTILNALRTSGPPVTIAADTIADTLGITGCGPDSDHWCADDGVTNGTFQVPAGYTLNPALSFTLQPVGAELSSACVNYSYYTPCYSADGSAEVRVYTRPASVLLPAGSGGVEGLASLEDPSSDSARVSLLFAERAYWLFLTGHRQGDLRRLVRNYGRPQQAVYPTGAYFGGLGAYGSDVTLPIPAAELPNPLFHGCIDRRA